MKVIWVTSEFGSSRKNRLRFPNKSMVHQFILRKIFVNFSSPGIATAWRTAISRIRRKSSRASTSTQQGCATRAKTAFSNTAFWRNPSCRNSCKKMKISCLKCFVRLDERISQTYFWTTWSRRKSLNSKTWFPKTPCSRKVYFKPPPNLNPTNAHRPSQKRWNQMKTSRLWSKRTTKLSAILAI